MAPYNPEKNYIAAHLLWIKNHSTFVPKSITFINDITYYQTMSEWYGTSKSEKLNYIAYLNYRDDKRWKAEYQDIDNTILEASSQPVAFVTLGFNHQEFTIPKAIELVKSLLSSSFVKDGSFAVMENYRENGEHPHCHIKLIHDNKVFKSQIIQAITRLKHAKKLILNRNFVDYKVFEPRHDLYLQGIKKENKLPFVELDKQWRQQNNIPDIIQND